LRLISRRPRCLASPLCPPPISNPRTARRTERLRTKNGAATRPALSSPSPVGEYRKITEEVLRYRPDRRRHPISAAESTRAFLMLRLGLHLGLRQKNLRQLLFKPNPRRSSNRCCNARRATFIPGMR